MYKIKYIIISLFFITGIFNFTSYGISFDNLLKESVISFFAKRKVNKIYVDNFKYAGKKIADNFIGTIPTKITNKVLLQRNIGIITEKEFIENNKTQLLDSLTYFISSLNKNNPEYNGKIAKILFQLNGNISSLNDKAKNILLTFYNILNQKIQNENILLFNNKNLKDNNDMLSEKEIKIKNMELFYKKIYNFNLLINMIGNYIIYKNNSTNKFKTSNVNIISTTGNNLSGNNQNIKNQNTVTKTFNKKDIMIYFNGMFLYNINSSLIQNLVYKYDFYNNTTYVTYLNMFRIFNNSK